MTADAQKILTAAKQLPRDEQLEIVRSLLHIAPRREPEAETVTAKRAKASVERWRGAFEPAERDDELYRALARKYL